MLEEDIERMAQYKRENDPLYKTYNSNISEIYNNTTNIYNLGQATVFKYLIDIFDRFETFSKEDFNEILEYVDKDVKKYIDILCEDKKEKINLEESINIQEEKQC